MHKEMTMLAICLPIVFAAISLILMVRFDAYMRSTFVRDGKGQLSMWFDRGMMAATLVVIVLSGAGGGVIGFLLDSIEVASEQELKASLEVEDIVIRDIEVFMQYRLITTPEHPERLIVRHPSLETGEEVAAGKRYRVWRNKSYVYFIEPMRTVETSNEDGETHLPEEGL